MKSIVTHNFKLAMPLPKADGYPEDIHAGGYALRQTQLEMSDHRAEEFANQHGPLKYKGHGTYAVAWTTPDGRVLKRTNHRDEFDVAKHMVGHNIPCVVTIHKCYERPEEPERYVIVTDEVRPLPEWQREIWDAGVNACVRLLGKLSTISRVSPNDIIHYYYRDMGREGTTPSPSVTKTLTQLHEFASCLATNGMDSEDAYARNVGLTESGQLVLLDLGGATSPSKKARCTSCTRKVAVQPNV